MLFQLTLLANVQLFTEEPAARLMNSRSVRYFDSPEDDALQIIREMKTERTLAKCLTRRMKIDPVTADRAAEILLRLGPKDVVPEIMRLFEVKDWWARWSGARALCGLSTGEVVEKMVILLKDEDWIVRKAALEALGEAKAYSTIPFILPMLADMNAHVHRTAIETLGQLKAQSPIPRIVPLLIGQEGMGIGYTARSVLERLVIQDSLNLLETAIAREKRAVRRAGGEVLETVRRRLSLPGARPALVGKRKQT